MMAQQYIFTATLAMTVSAFLSSQHAFANAVEVLMVGNSYARRNGGLNNMVEAMLRENDAASNAVLVAGDGLQFVDHVERGQVKFQLRDGDWDWVVLQEQSQIPGYNPDLYPFKRASLAAALELDSLIAAEGAGTIFLMTWGRRNGDTNDPLIYPDFLTMNRLLFEGYNEYQSFAARPTKVAYAGLAFEEIYNRILAQGGNPLGSSSDFYKLYSDNSGHPSPTGSYLTACVVYATITDRDPRGLTYIAPDVSTAEAVMLRSAAAEVAFTQVPAVSPAPVSTKTSEPTFAPKPAVSPAPVSTKTLEPTFAPTSRPTHAPTNEPTKVPTHAPTKVPTFEPTNRPTLSPTNAPTNAPTKPPTNAPTSVPTNTPASLLVSQSASPSSPVPSAGQSLSAPSTGAPSSSCSLSLSFTFLAVFAATMFAHNDV